MGSEDVADTYFFTPAYPAHSGEERSHHSAHCSPLPLMRVMGITFKKVFKVKISSYFCYI